MDICILFDLQKSSKECKGVFILVSVREYMIHKVTQATNRAAAILSGWRLLQLQL